MPATPRCVRRDAPSPAYDQKADTLWKFDVELKGWGAELVGEVTACDVRRCLSPSPWSLLRARSN